MKVDHRRPSWISTPPLPITRQPTPAPIDGARLPPLHQTPRPGGQSPAQVALGAAIERLEASRAGFGSRTTGDGPAISATRLRGGAASGVLLRDPEAALARWASGQPYVFCAAAITPANVEAALHASALLVPAGRKQRRSVHRAFAALGKPALAVKPTELAKLSDGGLVTVDGTRGRVLSGAAAIVDGPSEVKVAADIAMLRKSDPVRITAEAGSVQAVQRAKALGADAVRIDVDAILLQEPVLSCVRRYLLSEQPSEQQAQVAGITALVRKALAPLLEACGDMQPTVVLGSRSPQRFFGASPKSICAIADSLGVSQKLALRKVQELNAGNSKLGVKGVRWAVAEPQLVASVARAAFEARAAAQVGSDAPLQVLLPTVSYAGELAEAKRVLEKVRAEVAADVAPVAVQYGAGISTARGALQAGAISEEVSFFEYGLDDLTETLFALSRDDAERFLPEMVDAGMYSEDPFERFDTGGLGAMIRVAQYIAGQAPNAFAASIRGPQALSAEAHACATSAGITSLTVPVEDVLQARLQHARRRHEASVPAVAATAAGDLLSVRVDASKLAKAKSKAATDPVLPEGMSALELVQGLIAKVDSGLLSVEDALVRVPPDLVDVLGRPMLDPAALPAPMAKALAASPGSGVGRIALSSEAAAAYQAKGEPYVLMVKEVYGDDVTAVRHAEGLVSVRGGKTSHAAMVAANSDVPCVMDDKVRFDHGKKTVTVGAKTLSEGDWISIDGTKGTTYAGKIDLIQPTNTGEFATLMSWADEHRALDVLANADTPDEVQAAFDAGANAIGLVRTEHMFLGEARLEPFQAAILSPRDSTAATQALAAMEEAQTADFTAMLVSAAGRNVAIRLLDAPLHEFMPHDRHGVAALAKRLGISVAEAAAKVDGAKEVDSLMGLRGPRLAAVRPEIERMQVRAMVRAYVAAKAAGAQPAPLQVTVPLVNTAEEMAATAARVHAVVAGASAELGMTVPYELGAMIETPRAALDAARIAEHCTYFSFGTNDLTQFTTGYGRNVARQFVPKLVAAGAIDHDPTVTLDTGGVARLLAVADALGRVTRPDLHSGVCGGHGSDPASVRTIHALGLGYVSVPPGQVARAKVAAARAAVLEGAFS